MRAALFLFLLFLSAATLAQPVHTLYSDAPQKVDSFLVLADRGYSFNEVLSNKSLPFIYQDSLKPGEAGVYWIRFTVVNPSQYAKKYEVFFKPAINNTLYCYDEDQRVWNQINGGYAVRGSSRRHGIMPCMLQGNTKSTLYIRADIRALGNPPYKIRCSVRLEPADNARKQEAFLLLVWLGTILVIVVFFIYNAVTYFSFKDKTYFYYLVVQAGGAIYITANMFFFNVLFPWRILSLKITASHIIYFYDLNGFLQHIGIITVIFGFTQLARAYLNTKSTLPVQDKILKYGLYTFILLDFLTSFFTISGLVFTDHYTSFYSNIGIMLMIGCIFYTALAGRLRKLRAAQYFFIANIIPLGCMLALAIYFAVFRVRGRVSSILPNLAIISQALSFAFAIVGRVRLIREELDSKHAEALILKDEIEQLLHRQLIVAGENEHIRGEFIHERSRNEVLQASLEANERELASITLYMHQRNELLMQLKTQIQNLNKLLPQGNRKAIKDIESNIKNNLHLGDDWEKFKIHFEQVHPRFFEDLKRNYPALTRHETRLCAYFHINLSTKEIAALLNIDPASVRRAKTRLTKKMAQCKP